MDNHPTLEHDEATLRALIRNSAGPRAEKYTGLVVGAVVGRKLIVEGWGRIRDASGRRGLPGGVPDRDTIFQIGSITKVFTGLLLLDAVERGEVALDQPVATWIRELRSHSDARPITFESLATHTSGLPRLPPGLGWWKPGTWLNPYAKFGSKELLKAVAKRPRHAVGHYRYSNFGSGVLGEALSRAAGLPFEDLLQGRICAPLGLLDTFILNREGRDSRISQGHSKRGHEVDDWVFPAIPAAGAIYSTAADLSRVISDHLFPEHSPFAKNLEAAMEERALARKNLGIGLAWHISHRKEGRTWHCHNGGTGGHFSCVALDRERGRGAIALANCARPVDEVAFDLLDALVREAG